MGKKYNVAVTLIAIGICIFTSLFFLFSMGKINDIYVNQAKKDIMQLKKTFLKNTVNNLIQEIDVERELDKKLYEKIVQKQYSIIESKEDLPENEYEKYLIQYFATDEDTDFWNVLIWDSTSNQEVYDPQNLVDGKWDGNIQHLNIELSSYRQINRGKRIFIYGISKQYIDGLVKNKIAQKIRMSKFDQKTYMWVNEVLDYNGGDNYAIRRVHPNLQETEGSYLSTNTTDIKGNYPYKEELEGVKKHGELFFTYYFKKMDSDEVSEKLTYAKLYKDFDWIIAMGIHLDDIQEYINLTQNKDRKLTGDLTVMLVVMLSVILIISFGIIIIVNRIHFKYAQKITEAEINQDQLTKASSRRYGTKELARYFNEFKKTGQSPAIMIFDIDFFKKINDNYGHDVGDRVLRAVIDTVYQAIRSSDIIIRWGGDEFVGIFPGLRQENCFYVGEKIRSMISLKKINSDNEWITITVSIGFSYFNQNDIDYMDVIKRADAALYEAKTSERNCVRVKI